MGEPMTSEANTAERRCLPVLLLLFALSGCSALIYEIVWFQLLQLVIGSSAVSLGVLLATFMGGMCLGSFALPRVISGRWHPFAIYAALEVGIGVLGLAVLHGMPYLDRAYTAVVGTGLPAVLLRGAVCAVCLLPPTMLMGATLPAIARWVETTPRGVSWLGLFYGGNIAGAVFGCLFAGFYLLRVHDMATATDVAAALNTMAALLSLGLAALTPHRTVAEEGPEKRFTPPRNAWPVHATIALSGAGALAAEVIWTRLLSLLLGATVYTFSIILAVFLIGLGLGSSFGALLARATPRPKLALGFCQLLLAAAVAWTAFMVAKSLPYWPVNPYLSRSPWFTFQVDLVRCLWAVLPATILWGASFPLALAAAASPGQDPGRLVGGVYTANTLGAIAGALCASLVFIPEFGTQTAQRILIALAAAGALLALLPIDAPPVRLSVRLAGAGALLVGIGVLTAGLSWTLPAVPWELVAFGRTIHSYDGQWTKLYMGEGMNSSVAVTALPSGVRNFHVSGKVEASSEPQDMRLQRMLGHIPAVFHPRPRRVLVVGCGAGVTSGSFVVHPEVERIVICEIEPLVPHAVAPFFATENHNVVHDPRVQIIHDDARHFILTTSETFDIITSDPIHPWVKGSATLYTKEYFELCKRRLNPGGLITQWVPLYESNRAVVKSEIATFFEAFPHGTVWSNDQNAEGYDIVLLGSAEPLALDADEIQGRLERPDHSAVVQSLDEVGFQSVVGLLATYGGQWSDLRTWLTGAEINRDRNLRLQYLAGLGLNADQSKRIHEEIMSHRRFPENLLVGSGLRARAVRVALTRGSDPESGPP